MPHFDVAPGLKIWLETHDGFSCRTSCGRGSFLFILTLISPPPASPADAKSSLLPSTCRTDLQCDLSKPAVSPQVSALNPSEVPVSQTGTRSIDSPWSPCECLQVWKPAFLRGTGNLCRHSLSHPLSCSLHRRCSLPDPLGSRVDTDKHREFVMCLCVSVSIQGTEANKFRPNYRWGQLERHGGEETEDVKLAQSIYNYLQSPPVPHKMHRLKWTWKTSG